MNKNLIASNPLPELLCPAGSPEKLRYAFAFGADAVYAGVPLFSLRARENPFTWASLKESVDYAHALGKKVYLTVNIFARNSKINTFARDLEPLLEVGADGMIMSDPGLIAMVKERSPETEIHLSVQANCMNWQGVKFWQSIGVTRVILSRELRLEEIRTIKDKVPEMELEAFVHGSICIAYSGRCLLSRYMSYRDANQGVCDNSCRYPMKIHAQSVQENDFYLEDQRQPGLLYRIDEDEHGTYIMNAKDLRLIEYLRELKEAGVCSFKIEGRTKSLYYLSTVTHAYRRAIDDLDKKESTDPSLIDDLERITRRGYHSGFLFERDKSQGELFNEAYRASDSGGFSGIVRGPAGDDNTLITEATGKDWKSLRYVVNVRGKLEKGKSYEALTPHGVLRLTVDALEKRDGAQVNEAHSGSGDIVLTSSTQLFPFTLIRSANEEEDQTSASDASHAGSITEPEESSAVVVGE